MPLGKQTGPKPKNDSSSSLYSYVTPEVMSTVVGAALGEQVKESK